MSSKAPKKRAKQSCLVCSKVFAETHKCLAGECSTCDEFFLNVSLHKCPVAAALSLEAKTIFDRTKLALPGRKCDGCDQRHLVTSNVNPFRTWKSYTFCADCYRIDEIQREISDVRNRLRRRDIDLGHVHCKLCAKKVIDSLNQRDLCAYERDHLDVFSKRDGVGVMCQRGDSWSDICREADQCRILCKRCHSIVTYAQRETGLLRLKGYTSVSPEVIAKIQCVTQELIDLLLSHLQ